jgi:hypothetical protein
MRNAGQRPFSLFLPAIGSARRVFAAEGSDVPIEGRQNDLGALLRGKPALAAGKDSVIGSGIGLVRRYQALTLLGRRRKLPNLALAHSTPNAYMRPRQTRTTARSAERTQQRDILCQVLPQSVSTEERPRARHLSENQG